MEKTYRVIDEETVLFNDEHYLTVWRCPLGEATGDERDRLFQILYTFENTDIDLEIDVSEEAKGVWHLQLLVPAMLTPPELALKRLKRGKEALLTWLADQGASLTLETLQGDEIFWYVKRYNPDVRME